MCLPPALPKKPRSAIFAIFFTATTKGGLAVWQNSSSRACFFCAQNQSCPERCKWPTPISSPRFARIPAGT